MIPSFADATAAARRIQAGRYTPVGTETARVVQCEADARLLAAFVLAGDTERLRTALAEVDRLASVAHDAIWHPDVPGTDVLHANDRDDSAQSAIWAIHALIRPLLAEGCV